MTEIFGFYSAGDFSFTSNFYIFQNFIRKKMFNFFYKIYSKTFSIFIFQFLRKKEKEKENLRVSLKDFFV